MQILKQSVKSKTMWFAGALSVLGVLQANSDVFTNLMTPEAAGWATTAVGVAVAVLRAVTTSPISQK